MNKKLTIYLIIAIITTQIAIALTTVNVTFNQAEGTYNTTFARNFGTGLNFSALGISYTSSGGIRDGYINCSGTASYLIANPFQTINPGFNNLTVSSWVKCPTGCTGTAVAHYDTTGTARSWSLGMNGSGQVAVLLSETGGGVNKSYTSNITRIDDQEWHQIGFTFGSGILEIYVDGTNVSTIKTTDNTITNLKNSTYNVTICSRGVSGAPASFIQADIDEILVTATKYTPTEMQTLYNSYQTFCEGYPNCKYYFSNAGNDSSRNGNSTAPYKTITKLNSIVGQPGYTYYFKRGDTWRSTEDAYIEPDSGNSTADIIYDAYGTGDKPIILGSYNASAIGNWTNKSTVCANCWESTQAAITEIGNIIVNDNGSYYTSAFLNKSWTVAGLDTQGKWYYNATSKKVLVYSVSNPSTYYNNKIELAEEDEIFEYSNEQYLRVQNLHIKNGAKHGISTDGTSHHVHIFNNTLTNIGGANQSGTTRYGNALEVGLTNYDIEISYNKVFDVYDAALSAQSWASAGAKNLTNIAFHHNIVYGAQFCYEYFNTVSTSITNNVTVDQNTFMKCGASKFSTQSDQDAYCMVGNTNPSPPTTQNWTNNICYSTRNISQTGKSYFISLGRGGGAWTGTVPQIDYNTYYDNSYYRAVQYNLTYYTNISTFSLAKNQEVHGLEINPLFLSTDPDSESFAKPTPSSPVCSASNTGGYVGAVYCIPTTSSAPSLPIFTNPTAGQTILSSTNFTWTSSVASNDTTYINYYTISFINSTSSEVRTLLTNDTTTVTGDDYKNYLVDSMTRTFYGGRLSGTSFHVTYVWYYYDNTSESEDHYKTCSSYCTGYSYTFNNPQPTKRVVNVVETVDTSGYDTITSSATYERQQRGNQTSVYWDLQTDTVPLGVYNLLITTYDNYESFNNTPISVNITRATKSITTNFINQATGAVVTANVSIDFISETYTVNLTTTSGSITTVLVPETYTIRYASAGYATRFYYISLSNSTDLTLDLYMISSSESSNITFTVIDENANAVQTAYVKALKYDVVTNSYLLQETGQTDINGQTILHLTRNNEFYKFMVEYNGIVYLITTPAYINSDSYVFQIQTTEDFTQDFQEYQEATKVLDYSNTTHNFRLSYSFPAGAVYQVGLFVTELGSSGYVNQSYTTSNAATMLLGITPVPGKTYVAQAFYYPNGERNFLASYSITYPDTTVSFGRFGLFIQILITLLAAFTVIIDLSLALIAVPGSLLLGYWFGLTTLGLAPIVGLVVVGLILAVIVGRK